MIIFFYIVISPHLPALLRRVNRWAGLHSLLARFRASSAVCGIEEGTPSRLMQLFNISYS